MNKQKALDSIPAAPPSPQPNPEVVAQAQRRRFSPEYKLRLLTEADQAKGAGGVGALLRREGLYFSLLTDWRRERNAANLQAFAPQKRGPKSHHNPLTGRVEQLRRQNQRLAEELRKAEIVIDIQKTVAALFSQISPQSGRKTLMNAVAMLGPTVGIAAACDFLDVPRASYYRQHPLLGPAPQPLAPPLIVAPTLPARALRPDERQAVRDLLYSTRFQDTSPAAVQATLLDESQY